MNDYHGKFKALLSAIVQFFFSPESISNKFSTEPAIRLLDARSNLTNQLAAIPAFGSLTDADATP